MATPIGPEPYLDWSRPYTMHHIMVSLKDRDIDTKINVVGVGCEEEREKKSVSIVEGPTGCWVAWCNGDIALPLAVKTEVYQHAFACQKEALGVGDNNNACIIKVPECSDFLTDSGPAAILNASWLLKSKRKGHPGSQAYLDVRKDDTHRWLSTNTQSNR